MTKLLRQFVLIATLAAALGLFIVPESTYANSVLRPVVGSDGKTASGPVVVKTEIDKGYGCSIIPLRLLDCIYGSIGLLFWNVIIPTVSGLLWLVGMMIDGIISLSFVPTFYDHPAIQTSWTIIRDLCNMVFIFILIYTGLQTILNLGNSATIKKAITGVIISALLINFSFFITKVVIDVSNIGTSWFIQGVKNIGGGNGVSDSVRGVLQMEKLVKNDQFGATAVTLESFVTGLALIVLNLVAIYVFFKVFFLLLGRLISFMFLLVTAPVGFLRWVDIPKINDLSKRWWDELLCQATVAPMFFLMLYITLYIVDQVDNLVFGAGAVTHTFKTGSFAPANYIMFAIIIVMLLKSLEIAKDKGCELGNTVGDLFKNASGLAFGGVTAGFGALGRQTAGRYFYGYTQDKEKMKGLQERAATSMLSRMKLSAINKAATSSFDARATKIGGGALGALGGKMKIPGYGDLDAIKVGKTETEGFKGGVEAFKKAEKEWAEKNFGKKGTDAAINKERYAQSMQDSAINRALNPGIRYKDVYDDLRKDAKEDLTKSVKEDSKKKASAKQNQVVLAETVQAILKKSALSNNPKDVERVASTGKSLVEEMKTELKKEGEDDYLKYVRGFDAYNEKVIKEGTAKSVELDGQITNLRDQAQFLMREGADKNKDEITRIEKEIVEKSTERNKINQEVKEGQKRYEELAKGISAEDREKAAKKFAQPSQKDWEEARSKHINNIDQITKHIEAAEKALAKALDRSADLATKKTGLADAERSIKDLVGKSPKYAGKGKNKRQIEKGSGLKQQAADLKDKFNEKNNELRVEEKEEGDEKEEEGDAEKKDGNAEQGGGI